MSTQPIPPEGAARFAANLESLVRSAEEACQSPAADPAQLPRWNRAVGLLRRDLAVVQAAVAQSTAGQQDELVAQASRLRFLAKQMDGYKLDFAGPDFAERLESARRLTVLVAWQVFAAGAGSPASGL